MTTVKITKTSKKYAEALFDTALKQNVVSKVLDDLLMAENTINSNAELNGFLNSPVVKVNDKKEVVNQLFQQKIEQITLNLLYLLADNSRFSLLNEILEDYKCRYNFVNEIVSVKAVTAVEMKDYLKEKLQQKLENKLQKKVIIDYEVDTEIIAGLVLEIDGTTIDSSVQTKLKNIKKQII